MCYFTQLVKSLLNVVLQELPELMIQYNTMAEELCKWKHKCPSKYSGAIKIHSPNECTSEV